MSMVTAGIIGTIGNVLGGLFGMSSADAAARRAAAEKDQLNKKLTFLENNRQKIMNPYENAKDLSNLLSNPMANLSVATQAAEIQIEQADISLANTLDTIRSTGASAGGATALAQAALQSKKGVSASIEAQEAQNEKLRAQGEQALIQQQMAEKQRMQSVDAAGKQFMFTTQEGRDTAEMDRLSAQISGATSAEMQANADSTGAMTGMIGGITSTLGSMATSGVFNKKPPSSTGSVFDDLIRPIDK